MTTSLAEETASLAEGDFPAFFEEVHGWEPFPWQLALLRRVLRDGWPGLIDVPTGLGKTAVLDIAVFVNAIGGRNARRRVFLVVDRRLIVDQAHEHALRLQQALADASPGTLSHAVAARLAAPGDDGPALDVSRMRGGATWSWLWLERPDRHAIVTGTIDQIGSRLLFRGYGVGQRLWPVDAALTGTDSLVIVDEAHLSDPFLTTARDATALGRRSMIPGPAVVAMSASPGEDNTDAHRITEADERHPVATKRLTAPKRLHLVSVPAARDAAPDAVAAALAHWAMQIGGPGRVTGIVANTVAMARAVFTRIQAGSPEPGLCVLLTGRVRPVDREYLMHDWYPRIQVGAARDASRPLYVVATQSIEVGADVDLDGLVTQSAALPSIIQRLGRLNRRGDRDNGDAVLVHADALEDPVYGSAARQAWNWVASLTSPVSHRATRRAADLGPGADASPAALRRAMLGTPAGELEKMRGPGPYTPLVSEVALDAWSRTSPVPHPDVPVAPYLHGIDSGEPTVSIAWRSDMPAADPRQWRRSTELVPPAADEAIELPLSAARRWLATLPPGMRASGPGTPRPLAAELLSDAESSTAGTGDAERPNPADPGHAPLVALRYEGLADSQPVTAAQIRPGDLLIVPAAWGGCDRFGWDPASDAPVTDIGDLTGGSRRSPVTVRLGPTLADAVSALAPDLSEPVRQLIAQVAADFEDDAPDPAHYRSMLAQMIAPRDQSPERQPLPHHRVLRRLATAGRLTSPHQGDDESKAPPVFTVGSVGWNDDTEACGTSASPAGRAVTLTVHQAAVRDRAGEISRNLGLPAPVTQAVMLAAGFHDEGKRDPRFQLMLHAGDIWQHAAAAAPLAKSGMDPADRDAFRPRPASLTLPTGNAARGTVCPHRRTGPHRIAHHRRGRAGAGRRRA
jgi:CRISPR-associated endonuclease/helicase Cas3